MAIDEPAEGTVAGDGGGGTEQGDEEREIRDLEAEVNEMAERIQRSRRSVPGRLAEALSAQLAAQRPRIPAEGPAGLQDNSSQNESEFSYCTFFDLPQFFDAVAQSICEFFAIICDVCAYGFLPKYEVFLRGLI